MPKWKIKQFRYDNLPAEINKELLSQNGCGAEYASYLVLYCDGKIYDYESDAIEPEDKSFNRDLDFIERWINIIIESQEK